MLKKCYLIVLAIFIISMTGCATVDNVKESPKKVKTADWSKMETVSVKLSEYRFTPSTLRFKKGVPYKLEIQNTGTMKHYFVSVPFFKSISTRKVQSSDGEIKAPYFTAIEVFPGKLIDLYFIPIKAGTYNLKCTINGHKELGMVGNIIVEGIKKEEFRGNDKYY
jgi:uncharacterized cupredoxin-like copper-binding protein